MFPAPFHGFAFWFDVQFIGPGTFFANGDSQSLQHDTNIPIEGSQRRKRANPNETLVLSTAPEEPPTHWEQVNILYVIVYFSVFSPFATICQPKSHA